MTNLDSATVRTNPPFATDEAAMLNSWLDYHRATLALKCEGLTVEQLRERSCPPSSLSLLGLVRHMAEVERHWFRQVLAGLDLDLDLGTTGRYWTKQEPDGDFDLVDEGDPVVDTAAWQEDVAFSRAVAAGLSLDAVGKRRWRDNEVTLRWILVHMIEEYARHNGHADLLRERIDGATGL